MYGFSGEHLLVLLIILLIFGPKRLPDLGHSIGRTLKNFKDGMNGGNATPGTKMDTSSQIEEKTASSTASAPSAVKEEVKAEKKEEEKV